MLFDKRDTKSAPAGTIVRKQKRDSRAKFGNETVTGAHRKPNGFHIMVRRLTQGMLRFGPGSAQALIRNAHFGSG